MENPSKHAKLITLIKSRQEQKVPVHAIGSQAHVNVWTSFETMDQALAEMQTLGLPIHITELDVNITQGGLVDDANRWLADAYAGIFRAFLKHKDSVERITFWGVNDAVSWRSNGNPLLFYGDNQPKPAFAAVIRVSSEEAPVVQQPITWLEWFHEGGSRRRQSAQTGCAGSGLRAPRLATTQSRDFVWNHPHPASFRHYF